MPVLWNCNIWLFSELFTEISTLWTWTMFIEHANFKKPQFRGGGLETAQFFLENSFTKAQIRKLTVIIANAICILHGIILGVACFKQHCSSHTIFPCFYFFAIFHQTGINTNTLVQMRLYYCQQNHTNSPAQTNITPPNLNPTPSTPNQNMQVYIFTALCTILLWVNLRFDK